MTLSSIVAKSEEFLQIKRDIDLHRLSHAYIITAPDGLTGREFFLAVARQVMYKYGFISCDLVDYKIQVGAHPDVKIAGGEDKILVKIAEDIVADIYTKGLEADYKLYLLDAFNHPIEAVVQNKLLKVFEEPPQGVSIFILTPSESSLLATIISRAKKITIPPLDNLVIAQFLQAQGILAEAAHSCARLAGGSPELAIKFAQEQEHYFNIVAECVRILQDCNHSSKVVEFLGSEALNKDNFVTSLYFFEIIFQDLAHKLADGGYPGRVDEFGIEQIAGFSFASLAQSIKAVHKARQGIMGNIDIVSVAETMLFNILEAKYKWQ